MVVLLSTAFHVHFSVFSRSLSVNCFSDALALQEDTGTSLTFPLIAVQLF